MKDDDLQLFHWYKAITKEHEYVFYYIILSISDLYITFIQKQESEEPDVRKEPIQIINNLYLTKTGQEISGCPFDINDKMITIQELFTYNL